MKRINKVLFLLIIITIIISLSACTESEKVNDNMTTIDIDEAYSGYFKDVTTKYYEYDAFINNKKYVECADNISNKTLLMVIKYSIDGNFYNVEFGNKYRIYLNYSGGTCDVEHANTAAVTKKAGQSICFEFSCVKTQEVKTDEIKIRVETRNSFVAEIGFFDNATYYFGSYPQSLEIDRNTINELEEIAGDPTDTDSNWTSYNYYYNGETKSIMLYIDIDIDEDGSNDYRGVYIKNNRMNKTTDKYISESGQQYENGYTSKKTYWFKYEPIKWVEKDNGLLISYLILDSQEFDYNPTKKTYKNDYANSSLRTWLNDSFTSTAFSSLELLSIKKVKSELELEDNVFILSYNQLIDNFGEEKKNAQAKCSDYARCQGLSDGGSYGPYWLSDAYTVNGNCAKAVNAEGYSYDMRYEVQASTFGVRPSCYINE